MKPIDLTSALNCFSPWQAPSSLLTAMAVESSRNPLNTEPKPPAPSFSEKFFVARCKSTYLNAIMPPPP
uniref:Uncharacterized protein n=1 Tax=Triticum urartu TaxID=4572 RepID=A0A8R7PGB2_TRIUA